MALKYIPRTISLSNSESDVKFDSIARKTRLKPSLHNYAYSQLKYLKIDHSCGYLVLTRYLLEFEMTVKILLKKRTGTDFGCCTHIRFKYEVAQILIKR